MKRAIIMMAALGLTFQGIAQEKYIVSAKESLKRGELNEAKDYIDKAQAGETKDKPKTLFVKANIYMAMQQSDKFNPLFLYREATQAMFRLLEVKPDYEKSDVDQLFVYAAIKYYNDGSKAYNDKDMALANECMKNVVKIHDLEGGKRFDKLSAIAKKTLDTAYARANLTIANSVYYTGKFDEAIPLLITVKDNPITKTSAVYECLIQAYNVQKNTDAAFKIIEEAKKLFPDDDNIRHSELNYYIAAGKLDELIKKLEEAIAKEPKSADLLFNLATTYQNIASPKGGPKAANAVELLAKSEDAYKRALAIAPENAAINFNCGALYFNQAAEFNDKMNGITGTGTADQKNYDDFKAKRDERFATAMPYFEKAYSVYSANEANLGNEEFNTYISTINALKEVYARRGKPEKQKEMMAKLESLKKK